MLFEIEILVNGVPFKYLRPDQARNVPPKAHSIRGLHPCLKITIRIKIQYFESKLEEEKIFDLDQDLRCIDFQMQPFELTYIAKDGKIIKFYPDCWAIFIDGQQYVFDIKPSSELARLEQDEIWKLRLDAILKFCAQHGMKYLILTEKNIRGTRLNNIKDCLVAAKHFNPSCLNIDIKGFDKLLRSFLGKDSITFRDLVNLLTLKSKIPMAEIISLLKYKIYFGTLFIDWNTPLEDTPVSLYGEVPVSSHELPETDQLENEFDGIISGEKMPLEKGNVLADKDKRTVIERERLIKPIIDTFGKDASKQDVEAIRKVKGLPSSTYKWYLAWKKHGLQGLKPNRSERRKRRLAERDAEFLASFVESWNSGQVISKKAAYDAYCEACNKLDQKIQPVSDKTFFAEIAKLPFSEQQGKRAARTLHSIAKSLFGAFVEARYPGYFVQMDHTLLDIWLISAFTLKPLGRPWITLGIDGFSGSPWGYHLSFDNPSYETVTQAIINGISKKEESSRWDAFKRRLVKQGTDPRNFSCPYAGLPAIIQVDNGPEFRCDAFQQFCMDLNITLEYRPVKMPNYGCYVEPKWNTINDAIRNFPLPGRVFPLPKSRAPVTRPIIKSPIDHDPKTDARLKMDEFDEWLFWFFVVKYSNDFHAKQFHSPSESWNDGLIGAKHQPMGGALRVIKPSEQKSYEFCALRPFSASLSRHGLRYEKLLYSSPWLRDARKKGLLRDKRKYDMRVSHWDVRFAYMLDPETNEIETLEAYKFDGDRRVNEFLLQGLGKIPGKGGFPIPLNMIKGIKGSISPSEVNKNVQMDVVIAMKNNINDVVKNNKTKQKMLDKMARTHEGREKLDRADIILQMDRERRLPGKDGLLSDKARIDAPHELPVGENRPVNDFPEARDDDIEGFPTDWKSAQERYQFKYLKM